MAYFIKALTPFLLGLTVILTAPAGHSADTPDCDYDHDRLMALDEQAFDQDMEDGWRPVSRAGCPGLAADLIRDYRKHNDNHARILLWHEGQMRAEAGQTEKAIPLLDQARREGDDPGGWNYYVDGTIAFLKGDRDTLQAARDALAEVPKPDDFTEPVDADGNPVDISWPFNLPLLDRFLECFDSDYTEAYSGC